MSRALSNQIGQSALGTAKPAGSEALSGLTAEQQNPGYTPAEQANITGATTGGVGAAYGSAAEQAANTAARTNNQAGNAAQLDQLARQRMVTSGQLGAQNAETIANARIQGSQNANAGLGQLYGTSLGGANTASAASPSFGDIFGGAFGSALGKTLGTFGGSGSVGGASLGFG
jgi:hypothetical protein